MLGPASRTHSETLPTRHGHAVSVLHAESFGTLTGPDVSLRLHCSVGAPKAADCSCTTDPSCQALQLAAVRAVSGQLERFGGGMRADSEAQRAVMRGLLREEAARAEAAVTEVLQPSNVGTLAAYVFGSKGSSADLPVAQVRCCACRCFFVHDGSISTVHHCLSLTCQHMEPVVDRPHLFLRCLHAAERCVCVYFLLSGCCNCKS